MKIFSVKSVLLFGLLGVSLASVSGCGDAGSAGPSPVVEQDRLKTMTEMRAFFDKAHGDYSALSDADKAAFAKLAGKNDPEKTFNLMKAGGRAPAGPPAG